MQAFLDALLLGAGYNAALVGVGAAMLGVAAGVVGAFLFLRKRALVSDAVAHATLPGVAIAFLVMASLGGDGRALPALLLGSAVSASLGFIIVDWITRRTRLTEDAAIGAVLSVFFGIGVVLLTVIQNFGAGRPAGLESFLLGSTAGMLFQDALLIAGGAALALAAAAALRRPMLMVAFDPEFARASGVNLRHADLAMMALATAVTVIGLKLVGLALIVAMLIIPPALARFWTERADHLIWISAAAAGASGHVGASISAAAPKLPTGPIIVLCAFALFAASMLFAPSRGVLAGLWRRRRLQHLAHQRQGLLALAHGEPIFDRYTLRLLRGAGLIRRDGVATEAGRARAAKALRDERRWEIAREMHQEEAMSSGFDGLAPIEEVLTRDEIAEIDRRIGPPVSA